MELLILLINILLFMLFWKFVWQKTLIDTTRDALFDLRDEAREWFVKNNIPLDNNVYVALRKMINCHLRRTETITITNFAITMACLDNDSEFSEYISQQIDKDFYTEDHNIRRYTDVARKRAAEIITTHMVKRSFLVSLAIVLIAPLFALRELARRVYTYIKIDHGYSYKSLANAVAITTIWMAIVTNSPCGRFFGSSRVEEYSCRPTQNIEQCLVHEPSS